MVNVLAMIVQRVENAIHWINHYPVDSVVCFTNTYSLDSAIHALNNWAQDSRSSGPGSSPGRSSALCSLAREFTLIVPLSAQVYHQWVPVNSLLGVTL